MYHRRQYPVGVYTVCIKKCSQNGRQWSPGQTSHLGVVLSESALFARACPNIYGK